MNAKLISKTKQLEVAKTMYIFVQFLKVKYEMHIIKEKEVYIYNFFDRETGELMQQIKINRIGNL